MAEPGNGASTSRSDARGRAELGRALGTARGLFIGVGVFSVFVNLLMLTGPLFMLQVYERVLTSRSVPTLVALTLLVVGLYLAMGLLDYFRARVLTRAGARFQAVLDTRVFRAMLDRARAPEARGKPATGLRDVDAIQRLLAGQAPFAFFDAPWAPLYLAVLFLFHPWLGWMSVAGALVLVVLTLANERMSARPQAEALDAQNRAELFESALRRDAETLRALGMVGATAERLRALRAQGLRAITTLSDRTGGFSTASKTLRFFLQSAMLALGAYLVILEQVSAGVMIASSIMLGRALAPIEQAIGQWSQIQRARQGWRSLARLLSDAPPPPARTALPRPTGPLVAKNLAVAGPEDREPIVRGVTFSLSPGEALGVIGPSGSGKSTLSRALIGVWPALIGEVRLAGATYDQWDSDALGRQVGYLPQDVALIDGTVAENIARFDPKPDSSAIVRAAMAAGAHDTILSLPNGYDTPIGLAGAKISGGQRQRVALARALYGDPALVVLDEPNANLDAGGDQALLESIAALKARGAVVVVIAHRPGVIAVCDKLLMLEAGRQRAFGPRDEILMQTTKNAASLLKAHAGALSKPATPERASAPEKEPAR